MMPRSMIVPTMNGPTAPGKNSIMASSEATASVLACCQFSQSRNRTGPRVSGAPKSRDGRPKRPGVGAAETPGTTGGKSCMTDPT